MYTKDKNRSRDAQRTAERLYYKFIAGYVEAVHKDIHEEALALYSQAKRENPGVKDLTKTVTYMKRVHPGKPIPRHYTSKKRRRSSLPQLQGSTAQCSSSPQLQGSTAQCSSSPQMVLNIPLLPARPPTTCSLPPPPEVSTQPEVTTSPPEVSTQPEVTTSLPEVSTPLVLPPEIYNDLLADLRSDPDLWQILNDFEDNAMDDSVAEDIVWPDELTPLEIEVSTVFDTLA